MSNIVQINDANGVPRYYDFGTKNQSFLLTARELKEVGVKHWYFMLEVKYPNLGVQDIDPYNPNITEEEIGRIHIENKKNPWFFFRECARVPVRGAGIFPTILTRASAAAVWCFMHSIDFLLNQPRQTYKSTWLTIIVEYCMIYEFQNVRIPYMHIRQDRCLENAEMLRDYITSLPPYMNPWYKQNKLPGVKSLKYEEHGTSVAIISSADSEVKAKDKLRGMTLFLCFLDEWEYIPYIGSVLEGATPAIISGRVTARANGGRACMMLASTPGDLETTCGKEAQRIIDRTPRFSEKLYDFTDEQLEEYFSGNIIITEDGVEGTEKSTQKVTMLYIEYHYYQLRKDQAWLEEQHQEALRLDKMAEYLRGILLRRFRGGKSAFFKQEDIDYIQNNMREPDYEVMINNKFILWVYKHSILIPNTASAMPYFDQDIPYLIGIDCGTGKGGDNTAICIVHPYTLEVVGELFSPVMGLKDTINVVATLAYEIPNALFCLESNMTGVDIIDFVQDTPLEKKFYFDDRSSDKTKNVINPHVVNQGSLEVKAQRKRYFGTYVTASTRATMFNCLRDILKDYKTLLTTRYLVKDICNLVEYKNGKIAAALGEHDDMVMAYLHTIYILKYGYNLERYGVNKQLSILMKVQQSIEYEYEKKVSEDHIDNLQGLDSQSFEARLLKDMTTSTSGMYDEYGIDQFGYKQSDYTDRNSLKQNEAVRSSASNLAFLREVNDHFMPF